MEILTQPRKKIGGEKVGTPNKLSIEIKKAILVKLFELYKSYF